MKQKIVIKVTMGSEKLKLKGMQIVLGVRGVTSMTIDKENDKIVIIGEEIDVACMITSLRKKFHCVEIVSVGEVKPPSPPPPKPPPCPLPPCPPCQPPPCPRPPCPPCPPPPCQPPPCPLLPCPPCPPPPCQPCQPYYECPVYDQNQLNCSIM